MVPDHFWKLLLCQQHRTQTEEKLVALLLQLWRTYTKTFTWARRCFQHCSFLGPISSSPKICPIFHSSRASTKERTTVFLCALSVWKQEPPTCAEIVGTAGREEKKRRRWREGEGRIIQLLCIAMARSCAEFKTPLCCCGRSGKFSPRLEFSRLRGDRFVRGRSNFFMASGDVV